MNVCHRILLAAALSSCGVWAQAQKSDKPAEGKQSEKPEPQGIGGKVVELGVTPNPATNAPYNVNDVFATPGNFVVAIYSGNMGQWPDYDALLTRLAGHSNKKVGVVKVDSKNLSSSMLMKKLSLSNSGGMTLAHFYLVQAVQAQGSTAIGTMVRHEFDSASAAGTKIVIKDGDGRVVETKSFSGKEHYVRAAAQSCMGAPMGLQADSDFVKYFPCGTP